MKPLKITRQACVESMILPRQVSSRHRAFLVVFPVEFAIGPMQSIGQQCANASVIAQGGIETAIRQPYRTVEMLSSQRGCHASEVVVFVHSSLCTYALGGLHHTALACGKAAVHH